MKQNTKILWIIGIVLAVIIIGPKLGLFSVTGLAEGYISNEPKTIEELINSGFDEKYNYSIISGEGNVTIFYLENATDYILFSEMDSIYDSNLTCEQLIEENIALGDENISKETEVYGRDIYSVASIHQTSCKVYDEEDFNQCKQQREINCSNERNNISNNFEIPQVILDYWNETLGYDYLEMELQDYYAYQEGHVTYQYTFHCNETLVNEGYCRKIPFYCIRTDYDCIRKCVEWNYETRKSYIMCNNKNNIFIYSNNIIHQQNYLDYFIKKGIFMIGNFAVELWMVLVGLGAIFLIIIMGKK